MIAEIIINRSAKRLNRTFDYNIPKELEELIMIGSTVIVPFGKSAEGKEMNLAEGYVVGIKENTTYEVKDIVKEAKKHHMISYVWQNGGYTMFGVSILDVVKKIFSLIPLDSHYIKSLQETKFETDVVLNEALYDKVCFAGIQIDKLKKQHPEYRFYDVGKFGTELCKRDVGKLEAIRYICRKKGVSISSVMAFGDYGNDVDLLASCGYGVAMKNGSAQVKKAAKYISDYTNNEKGVLRFINSFFV